MAVSILTAERLRALFSYDPLTGIFIRTIATGHLGRNRVDEIAGYSKEDGYRCIQIDGRAYRSHRLAWMYMHGYMPDFIDHRNGNRADNRISNLRECSRSENMQNQKIPRTNSLGVKGVCQDGNRYRADINCNGKRYRLGSFKTIEAAKTAYDAAAIRLHGEFANLG